MKLHEASHGERVKIASEGVTALIIGYCGSKDYLTIVVDGEESLTNRHIFTDVERMIAH